MSRIYVAIDLETTGLSPERDAIIEIGAVRFRIPESPTDDPFIERWQTFVNPGRPIPYRTSELTGIRDEDVARAPALPDALDELRRFVGNYPVIGHNVAFELAFLQKHGLLEGQASVDTFELASLLLPDAPRYSLGELAAYLGLEFDGWHRALADAEMAAHLFLNLWHEACALPSKTLNKIVAVAMQSRWPLRSFFVAAQRSANQGGSVVPPRDDPMPFLPREPLVPKRGTPPILTDLVDGLLAPDRPIAQSFEHYEVRRSQQAMLRHVAEAFQNQEHLLVEVGAGGGKTLAYLISAIHLAVELGEPVVISTNTLNLQDQLFYRELPRLSQSLGVPFTAMRLKGRGNYVCPRRVEVLCKRGDFSTAEARLLTRVLIWLNRTQSGDRSELQMQADERPIWNAITSDRDSCNEERCSPFGTCYWQSASQQALGAHLLIVNHALLLADVATDQPALPPYRYLIIDEAHHLEEQATQQFGAEISRQEPYLILDILSHEVDGRSRGLLAEIRGMCHNGHESAAKKEIANRSGAASRLVDQARHATDLLYSTLSEIIDGLPPNGAQRTIDPAEWQSYGSWPTLTRHVNHFAEFTTILGDQLGALAELLSPLGTAAPEWQELRDECLRSRYELARLSDEIPRILIAPEENDVVWVRVQEEQNSDEEPSEANLTLHRAPLRVGEMLHDQLFATKASVVLTSATLSIDSSFAYLRERLGLNGTREISLESPYDFPNQALGYVVTDLPEPNQPHYAQQMHNALVDLAIATAGRMLVLFTSKSQLNSAYRAISNRLAQEDIVVLAQYLDGSRTQLLRRFQECERAILLGTHSFWEGIDVPGPSLSCVAITRLPFPVPVDPIQVARARDYDNAFYDYSLPQAVLRFRQGVGRLIRHRTDRGALALLDTRLANKRYGDVFINSLPPVTLEQGPYRDLPPRASRWIAAAQ
ncbi:MAG: DEAD/DEAH box helicase family protein [Anaerolineales bacterium]|nr:DEAD/DEAH box helicase family protein [Anaerolineales bacterium]MCB9129271.1 DEAD/DEAH box helicase family protein [Ardenticatenales bacterium]